MSRSATAARLQYLIQLVLIAVLFRILVRFAQILKRTWLSCCSQVSAIREERQENCSGCIGQLVARQFRLRRTLGRALRPVWPIRAGHSCTRESTMDRAPRTCSDEQRRAYTGALVPETFLFSRHVDGMHFMASLLGSNSWQWVLVYQKHLHNFLGSNSCQRALLYQKHLRF